MIKLIKRNLLIYFRDVSALIMSLLTVFIVIALYILFLADMQVDELTDIITKAGMTSDNIDWLVNCWILAGLMSIVPITCSMGALGSMCVDKERKIVKDFKSSPLNMTKAPLSYAISAAVIGSIMSVIAFFVYSLYIYIQTSHFFTARQILLSIAMAVGSSIFAACVMGFFVSFFKTVSTYTSASIVVGTVIGFVNGVYVPLGTYPDVVQTVVKILPFGNIALIFRKILMTEASKKVFEGVPQAGIDTYNETYGNIFKLDEKIVKTEWSLIWIAACALVCFILFMLNYNRKKKEF